MSAFHPFLPLALPAWVGGLSVSRARLVPTRWPGIALYSTWRSVCDQIVGAE
jgi:hypothetical protein